MINILIVEDDPELRELFATVLLNHQYTPWSAQDAKHGFDILENQVIDLIITDVMMPEMDGYQFVQALRETDAVTPILMITAKGNLYDKQLGFKAGVDDYMIKPVDVNEMIWRVEALLRRSKVMSQRSIQLGSTLMDMDTLTVTSKQYVQLLPQKEFALLFKLASVPGRIYTRMQLMNEIWGLNTESDMHTLDVHISRLRDRFKDNSDFEIVTVRGLGYKVDAHA